MMMAVQHAKRSTSATADGSTTNGIGTTIGHSTAHTTSHRAQQQAEDDDAANVTVIHAGHHMMFFVVLGLGKCFRCRSNDAAANQSRRQ